MHSPTTVQQICLVAIALAANAHSGALPGIGKLQITKMQMCDPKVDYPMKFFQDLSFTKGDGGKQLMTAKATFKDDFGKDSDYNLTIKIKKTKDEAEFSPLFAFYDEHTCDAIKKYLGDFADEMHKAAGLKPGECPVPKGEYGVKDFPLDLSMIPYQSIPEGVIQVEHVIKNTKTNEVLCCMIVEGDNFP